MARSSGNLALDVLVRQAESRLGLEATLDDAAAGNLSLDMLVRQAETRLGLEAVRDDAAAAVPTAAACAAAARTRSPTHACGGPLAAHPSLDAGCSRSRSTWPIASGCLRWAAADAADAGAGGLARETVVAEPLASDAPPGSIVQRPWNKSALPPCRTPPTASVSEDCQHSLAGSLKLWVTGQLSARDDMQRTALARLQGQLDRHRAEFEVGRKQLREDLAQALTAQRQAVEARLGTPLVVGASVGGQSCDMETARPAPQTDGEQRAAHLRTMEQAHPAVGQGDIVETLLGSLSKHGAELAAQRSELWDLGRELELCSRAVQERIVYDFKPAAEPSPTMDARHVALEDLVSGLGENILGLEAKLSEGLEKASEEQAKHERDHEALREDLRRLKQELREQFTQVGQRDAAAHEAVEQTIAARLATGIAPFEARCAALQASFDAVPSFSQPLDSSAASLSTCDDHHQAAVAVATAAASATDVLKAQFRTLEDDLHRLARELPREAELREGQARETAARLDDLVKSVDVLRQRRPSAEMSRASLSAEERLAFEQLTSEQVRVRKELNECSEKVQQEHDAVIDELREFGTRLTSFSARGDRSAGVCLNRPSQVVELENAAFQKLVADQASGQVATQKELERLSGQFQEEYAAVRKELEQLSKAPPLERRVSGQVMQSHESAAVENVAADHSMVRNELAELKQWKQQQDSLALENLAADHSVVRNELAELSSALCKQQQDHQHHASNQSQQILQSVTASQTSLHHELCELKQEQSTDRSKRERFLVDQLAAVEKTFHDELNELKGELKGQVKQDATIAEPDRDAVQQLVRDEIQELSGQLHREHTAAVDEVRGFVRECGSSVVPVRDDGLSVEQLNELGRELKEECHSACDDVRDLGNRVKEDAHHAREELREFGNQLANQASTWKTLGLEHGARLDMAEVDLRELKSEVCKRSQDDFVQGGSGGAPVVSDAESASDGMGPLADQKLHMGVSRNDWLLQMIDTEREERLKLKQSVDAERLARKEAADQDALIRDRAQVQMQKDLVKAIEMQLSRALETAQAQYKAHAEDAIERVTGQVNQLSAHAHSSGGDGGDTSKTEETEKEGEVNFEGVNSQALDELEREITSLREVIESKHGEAESGMTSVKDGLEEVTCKVCDLEGRIEVIETSEFGLKGDALEALSTFLKRTLYDELYSSIIEELGDHISSIRSDCEKLGHDIHEAEQKLEDLNEKWEEAEGHSESWLDRQERKFKDLESKLSKVENATGQASRDGEARRGALTLDADALMQLQMPRKSVALPPASRRSTFHGMEARESLQSEARSSTLSQESRMSVITRALTQR